MNAMRFKGSGHFVRCLLLVSVRIQIALLHSFVAFVVAELDQDVVNVGEDLTIQSSFGPRRQLS